MLNLTLSTIGFDAVALDLPELPPELIENVILAYSRFQFLNQMSDRWQEWDVRRRTASGGEELQLTKIMEASAVAYDTNLDGAIDAAGSAILALCPMLHRRIAPFATTADYVRHVERKSELSNLKATNDP